MCRAELLLTGDKRFRYASPKSSTFCIEEIESFKQIYNGFIAVI